ncbi:MAG: hypothetical protein U5K27_06055 [Desulfotignum sp.]|nr:hypothetical protein [Desulfotignum sp.]
MEDAPADYPVSTAFDQYLPVTNDPAECGSGGIPLWISCRAGVPGQMFPLIPEPWKCRHFLMPVPVISILWMTLRCLPMPLSRIFLWMTASAFKMPRQRITPFPAHTFSNDGEDVFIIFNNQGIVNQIVLTGAANTNAPGV